MSRPTWRLPAGVSRGTWDYLQSKSIAGDYDTYFAQHALMQLDLEFLHEHLPPIGDPQNPPVVADLGCGTGRVSRALSPLGYRLVNVDLSSYMLAELTRKTEHPEQNCCIQANLVDLRCLAPNSLDMAVCLFSSIGMIRGHKHRLQFLKSLRSALKPGARLLLHVHNRYHSLWDPAGPAWLLSTKWKSLFTKDWEFGDRVYAYRGLPAMFLHIFSRGELRKLLVTAGFESVEITPINLTGDAIMPPRVLTPLRAGGYFALAGRGGG